MSGVFSTTTNPFHTAHDKRKSHHDIGTRNFIGVDGEGMTTGATHSYVLLGVGDNQIENPNGLQWSEIFDFVYSFNTPRTAFVGFFLGYDFTQWLKTLPEDRARRLLTIEGRDSRRSQSPKMRGKFLPVDIDGWQIDMLGSKRFMLRRKPCECLTVKCDHDKGAWQYICDVGPFFQTSFLNVIDPKNWQKPIVTGEEYATICEGKDSRGTATLDDDMRRYNRLENNVLARVMRDLDTGFKRLDVNLIASQWYGPGQAAQSWMSGRAPLRTDIETRIPEWFLTAARESYFGGWFEQMAHGIIPGVSYENDINNAYPYIISTLPCLLHGTYSQGQGKPPTLNKGEICLIRALVWGQSPTSDSKRGNAIGAMLHRDKQGRISRPLVTAGWFWYHELMSAQRAKLITRISADRYYEWVKYTPCDCPPPMRQARYLYQMRLDVGKSSSLGKATKLINNSIYGKFAQSIGLPRFANAVYASLITAGCRTMITDAIATHPEGKQNVLMVATDAVFFLSPHPVLTYGNGLGEWETKQRENLTLFKPGVYWDDATREAIAKGEHASFKARGISARDFSGSIRCIDSQFSLWEGKPPEINNPALSAEELSAMGLPAWPRVSFKSSFAMTTALQALIRNEWNTAGDVDENKPLIQNANPEDKRTDVWYDQTMAERGIYRSEPHRTGRNARYRHAGNISEWDAMGPDSFATVPYEKKFGSEDPFSDESMQAFGINPDEPTPYRGAFRILTGQE